MTATNRLALLALILAGCGGGGDAEGDTCSRGSCADGLVCDLTDPGGSVCIDADGDLDGDGIPNSQDFCEHVAGGKFDEDQDGIGDDCDRCPIAPPEAVADNDDDEVDSPCDPEPSENGDEIVIFEGFNEGALPDGVIASAGWEFVTGEAIAHPVDSVNSESMLINLPLVSQHVAIRAQYRVDEIDASASNPFVGVNAIDQRPAGGSQVKCGGSHANGAPDILLLDADAGVATKDFLTSLFDPASLYRIAVQVDNAAAACAIVADNELGAVDTTSTGEAANHAGLTVRGAVGRFQYLLVVQKNPNAPPPAVR